MSDIMTNSLAEGLSFLFQALLSTAAIWAFGWLADPWETLRMSRPTLHQILLFVFLVKLASAS